MPHDTLDPSDELIIDGKHKWTETKCACMASEQADDSSSTFSIRQASIKAKCTVKKAGSALAKAGKPVANLVQHKKAAKPATGTGKVFPQAFKTTH